MSNLGEHAIPSMGIDRTVQDFQNVMNNFRKAMNVLDVQSRADPELRKTYDEVNLSARQLYDRAQDFYGQYIGEKMRADELEAQLMGANVSIQITQELSEVLATKLVQSRVEQVKIANNCNRLNDEKNEISKHCRSLERLVADLSQDLKGSQNAVSETREAVDNQRAMIQTYEGIIDNDDLLKREMRDIAQIIILSGYHDGAIPEDTYQRLERLFDLLSGRAGAAQSLKGPAVQAEPAQETAEAFKPARDIQDAAPSSNPQLNGWFLPRGWRPDPNKTNHTISARLSAEGQNWFDFANSDMTFFNQVWANSPAALEEIERHYKAWSAAREIGVYSDDTGLEDHDAQEVFDMTQGNTPMPTVGEAVAIDREQEIRETAVAGGILSKEMAEKATQAATEILERLGSLRKEITDLFNRV